MLGPYTYHSAESQLLSPSSSLRAKGGGLGFRLGGTSGESKDVADEEEELDTELPLLLDKGGSMFSSDLGEPVCGGDEVSLSTRFGSGKLPAAAS